MSDSSDEDIFAYQSLSKKCGKDVSGSSVTFSPNPPSQPKKSSGKRTKKSGKSKKGKEEAGAKEELKFEGKSQPPRADGFCPMCQMPLSIVIGSAEQHVARCIIELDDVIFERECPMGFDCDNTIRQHFQRYSHNLLSQKRAGVATVRKEFVAVKDEQPSGGTPASSPSNSPTDARPRLDLPGPNVDACSVTMDASTNVSNDKSVAHPLPISEPPCVKQNGYREAPSTPVKHTARKTFPHSPRQFDPEKVVYVLDPRGSDAAIQKGRFQRNTKSFFFKKELLAHSTRKVGRDGEKWVVDPGTNLENGTESGRTNDLGYNSEEQISSSMISAIYVSSDSSSFAKGANSTPGDTISGDTTSNHSRKSKHSKNSRVKRTVEREFRDDVNSLIRHSKSTLPQSHDSDKRIESLNVATRTTQGSVKSYLGMDAAGTPDGPSPPKRSKNSARKTAKGKAYRSIDEVLRAQRGIAGGGQDKKDVRGGVRSTHPQDEVANGAVEKVSVLSSDGGDEEFGSQTVDSDVDNTVSDCLEDLSDEGSQPGAGKELCSRIIFPEVTVGGQSSTSSQRSAESPSVFAELDNDSENGGASESSDVQLVEELPSSTPTSSGRNQGGDFNQSSTGSSILEVPSSLASSASVSSLGTSDTCGGLSKSSWNEIFKNSKGTKFSSAEEVTAPTSVEESGFHSSSSTVRWGSSMWSTTRGRQCPFYKKMPGTTFTVDAFSFGDIPGITAYFLTHFHADHYGGLKKTFTNPIYCSSITANLVKRKLYVPGEYVHALSMEKTHIIEGVGVTFLDANHCPGSVLILFCLPNGKRYLHTGDFRAHLKMESYKQLQACWINQLYLDTTYLDPKYDFPKQDEVVQYAVDLAVKAVRVNPKTLVLCGTYTIGKERVFRAIADALKCKICVESEKKRIFSCFDDSNLMAQIVTDKRATRLHVVSMAKLVLKRLSLYLDEFHGLYDNIIAFKPTGWTHSAKSSSLADIKPSTWGGRVKVYGIPYSEHSSYSEMKRFVQFIRSSGPVKIIPTVNVGNPKTRAFMESHFEMWLSEDYRALSQPEGQSSQRSQTNHIPHLGAQTSTPHSRAQTSTPHSRAQTSNPHSRAQTSTPHSRAQTSNPHARKKDQPASQEKTLFSFFHSSRVTNI